VLQKVTSLSGIFRRRSLVSAEGREARPFRREAPRRFLHSREGDIPLWKTCPFPDREAFSGPKGRRSPSIRPRPLVSKRPDDHLFSRETSGLEETR